MSCVTQAVTVIPSAAAARATASLSSGVTRIWITSCLFRDAFCVAAGITVPYVAVGITYANEP